MCRPPQMKIALGLLRSQRGCQRLHPHRSPNSSCPHISPSPSPPLPSPWPRLQFQSSRGNTGKAGSTWQLIPLVWQPTNRSFASQASVLPAPEPSDGGCLRQEHGQGGRLLRLHGDPSDVHHQGPRVRGGGVQARRGALRQHRPVGVQGKSWPMHGPQGSQSRGIGPCMGIEINEYPRERSCSHDLMQYVPVFQRLRSSSQRSRSR